MVFYNLYYDECFEELFNVVPFSYKTANARLQRHRFIAILYFNRSTMEQFLNVYILYLPRHLILPAKCPEVRTQIAAGPIAAMMLNCNYLDSRGYFSFLECLKASKTPLTRRAIMKRFFICFMVSTVHTLHLGITRRSMPLIV